MNPKKKYQSRLKKILISSGLMFTILVASLFLTIKFFNLDKNDHVLNYFAQFYFDKDYYLNNYPEIQNSNIDPFDHYISEGWKEGKNPNKDFDTKFYININPEYKKYKLNPLQHYVRTIISFSPALKHPDQFKKAVPLNNPKYYLAVVAIFRNEAPYLKEWIEFYRLMGVEHFYLYNHLSADSYHEVLDPYIKEGIVDLYPVTKEPKDLIEWNTLQTTAYDATAKSIKDTVEWLIIVDTDEFMFPVGDKDLKSTLKRYDDYASLSVNWKLFGSGSVSKIDDDKLLIESLTMGAKDVDLHVKSIVKPRYVESINNPHFVKLKPGYAQITENYDHFKGPFSPFESRDVLRINHYWARDWEFFKSTKLARIHIMKNGLSEEEKQTKIDSLIKMNKDVSLTYDGSILRFVPELRTRMGLPPQ